MRTYGSIEKEFCHHFGEAGHFSWCDLRPTFEGNLINASLAIVPLASAEATRDQAWTEFCKIWSWMRDWANYCDDSDWIQVVVAFPLESKPSGQIFKGSIKVPDLLKLDGTFSVEKFAQCGGTFKELFNWSTYSEIRGRL